MLAHAISAPIHDIRELIGNTPLLRLNNCGVNTGVKLYAKLEYWNPGGSVKDRIGVAMLADAEACGNLKPGATLIDATAGNTGLGIALAALNRGYRVIFTVPEKFSQEKLILIRALGAQIIVTPSSSGMRGAQQKAAELLAEIPNSWSLRQFENPANPLVHYEQTGPEIYAALNGELDYFVAGAGSGGTFSGVAKFLKEQNSQIQSILADPHGSTMAGGAASCYRMEGIGNDFIPKTMTMAFVDQVIKISDDEAFAAARLLARCEGVFAGSSSGAALAAAIKLSQQISHGTIVTLFPDRGDRYFSKQLYSDGLE